jgi:AcrR family transcriptional regulator
MLELGAPGSLDYLPNGQAAKPSRKAKPDGRAVAEQRRARVREAAAALFADRGPTGVSRRQVADAARMAAAAVERLYASEADLLGDVLVEFVHGLGLAVCRAFDARAELGGPERLETVVRAWLDYVAGQRAANRAFLLGMARLEEPHRVRVIERYATVVETVAEALQGAVPELKEISEGLRESIRGLLTDVSDWRAGPGPEARAEAARRISGMLLAAATAEAWGAWMGLGPVRGVRAEGTRGVDYGEARARFSDVLNYVAAGGELVVRRRGRLVAKVVGCGAGLA